MHERMADGWLMHQSMQERAGHTRIQAGREAQRHQRSDPPPPSASHNTWFVDQLMMSDEEHSLRPTMDRLSLRRPPLGRGPARRLLISDDQSGQPDGAAPRPGSGRQCSAAARGWPAGFAMPRLWFLRTPLSIRIPMQ